MSYSYSIGFRRYRARNHQVLVKTILSELTGRRFTQLRTDVSRVPSQTFALPPLQMHAAFARHNHSR